MGLTPIRPSVFDPSDKVCEKLSQPIGNGNLLCKIVVHPQLLSEERSNLALRGRLS